MKKGKGFSAKYLRPRAYDEIYQWHIGQVPETILLNAEPVPNPALHHAVFIVHGMGTQGWAETAGTLRYRFEDALERLYKKNPKLPLRPEDTPSPFIYEGYWANYDNLKETFPEEWKRLDGTKADFFSLLWKKRTVSALRTFGWLWKQLLRLINPYIIVDVSFMAWSIYVLLFLIAIPTLPILLIFFPRVLSQVIGDVRLYADPKGIVERAIVQRIDKRVGKHMLKMIGLDWDFRPLDPRKKIKRNGKPVEFDRIIWVAHSLGTVISYNVLSDLFHRAKEIDRKGTDKQQQDGVNKFRTSVRRFITLGSPLDKIAYLFGGKTLRPWPEAPRTTLLDGGEHPPGDTKDTSREWWINFFHVLDPVSGSLSNDVICNGKPPVNYHIRLFRIPGLAHIAYWKDRRTLQFLLSRVYGKKTLPVEPPEHWTSAQLTWAALFGYIVWLVTMVVILGVVVCCLAWLIDRALGGDQQALPWCVKIGQSIWTWMISIYSWVEKFFVK